MARSCGLRIGPKRFELVVLEGSPRKHRITAFATAEFPRGGEDPAAEAAAALKAAVKEHDVPVDAAGLAIDTGLAAFRTLKLPALDQEKIAQVIKFEVESQLPQWNIDEVIVDFQKLEEATGEANVLVTAVRKADLRREIDVCAKAGVEPLEAEIEATAMVNAALSADLCHVDDAQVLVHVGETSTAVVVMDGGHVRSMRAIHIGALSHEPGVAAAAPEGEGVEEAPPEPPAPPDAEDVQRMLEQNVSRIRRELGRTLSGAHTAHPIEAVYVCGWELPNLIGTSVLDVPAYELDVFEEDSGQPAQGAAPLVVAYGAALRQLGAVYIPARLRREELRFTGTLEKIELPAAVAALLLVTLLAIFNIFEKSRLDRRTGDVRYWMKSAVNYMQGDPKKGVAGKLDRPLKEIDDYLARVRKQSEKPGLDPGRNPMIDSERSPLEQMSYLDLVFRREIAELNIELGNTGEIVQPQSALEALTLVLGVLAELGEERVGRVAVRRADSLYMPGKGGAKDQVQVTLNLSFFAPSALEATSHLEKDFIAALREKPWVAGVTDRGSKEFEDGTGIFADNLQVICDLAQIDRSK